MKIPQDIQDIIKNDKVIPFGTTSKDGVPNINMIALKKVADDETILLADNYFNKTLENLMENSNATLITKKEEERRWYQLKGTCQYVNEGYDYEEFKKWVKSIKDTFPMKGMVVFKVKQIFNVTSGPDAGKLITL